MREIKFRAWDKRNGGQMLYKDLFDNYWYATPNNDEGGCHTLRTARYTDKHWCELMQYIGRKDKNGVEGYHKDIGIDDLSRYFVIEWNEEDGKWFLQPVDQEHKTIFNSNILQEIKNLKFLKIVGNIYENPELLGDD